MSKSNNSFRADSVRVSEKNFNKTLDNSRYKTRPNTGEDDIFAAKTHKNDRLKSEQSGRRFNKLAGDYEGNQKDLENIIG